MPAAKPPRRPLEFKSLGARIYFHGVVLMVISTIILVNVFPYAMRVGYADAYERFGLWITDEVCADAGDRAGLQRELDRMARAISIEATIRDASGAIVASSAHPPLDPLDLAPEGRGITFSSWDLIGMRLPEGAPLAGTIVWRRLAPPSLFLFVGVVGGAVFLLVALGTIPLARSMARPLRDLRDLARRFGDGALTTRACSTRADEIGDLARSFDEMAARIEQSRRTERELLAGVSHELRTPLARIRVAVDLASEGDAASAAAHLPGIHADLAEVERLLEDVLTAARLDLALPQDTFPGLQKDVVLASELTALAARRFEANHPARALDADTAHLGETALDVDATLVGRALQNLLDNAAKYSHEPIRLDTEVRDDRLTFRVIDTGTGISEADLAMVFTPFFRGDPSRTRATGGVGLGLALARRIARAHGGDVTIESQLGKGTTVSMELPVLGLG